MPTTEIAVSPDLRYLVEYERTCNGPEVVDAWRVDPGIQRDFNIQVPIEDPALAIEFIDGCTHEEAVQCIQDAIDESDEEDHMIEEIQECKRRMKGLERGRSYSPSWYYDSLERRVERLEEMLSV